MESFSSSTESSTISVLIVFVFFIEIVALIFVCVLEYLLRQTTYFPVREQNFSCADPSIGYTLGQSLNEYGGFAFNANVSYEVVIGLCFCLPPFIIIIGEICLWGFGSDHQKTVRVVCRACCVPQVVRRMLRYIGTFLFGLLITMIFTDVMKIMTGRLRPIFVSLCQPNVPFCGQPDYVGFAQLSAMNCTQTDFNKIRYGRLSFPSLHASATAFAATFLAVYFSHLFRAPGLRILRAYLSLGFMLMSVMSCMVRYGLHYSHWSDILIGFILGVIIALYLAVFVLNRFHEHMSSKQLYYTLKNFFALHRDLELRDFYRQNWRYLDRIGLHNSYPSARLEAPGGLIIPRPLVRSSAPLHQQTVIADYPYHHHSPPSRHHHHQHLHHLDYDHPPVADGLVLHNQYRLEHDRDYRKMYRPPNTFQRDLAKTLDQYRLHTDLNAIDYYM